MTNKLQQITILTLAAILIAGGFGLTQLAYSTGSGTDKKVDDKKGQSAKQNEDDDEKIEICHIPPGNHGNAHTIVISKSALQAHLSHGDHDDECDDEEDHNGGTPGKAFITLYKAITNDNGGTAVPSTFHVKVDSTEVTLGTPMEIPSGQPHTISETQVLGYSFVLIAGNDRCPALLNEQFTLKAGEKITCAIYNDDNANGNNPGETTITLKKAVTNDNGGLLTPADFEIQLDGVVVDQNTPIPITPGQSHTISEILQEGYSSVLVSGDGCPSTIDEPFIPDAGESIVCTIYNDDEGDGSTGGQGIIFQHNSMQIQLMDKNALDSCDNPSNSPCIEIISAENGIIGIVDSALTSDTTIVLYSVIEADRLDTTTGSINPVCSISAIVQHDKQSFYLKDPNDDSFPSNPTTNNVVVLKCIGMVAEGPDPDSPETMYTPVYNVNYVMIDPTI